MGTTQTRQEKEIVIAQSGNSGGTTASSTDGSKYTLWEVIGVCGTFLILLLVGWFINQRCKRNINKNIRREMNKSQELISIGLQNSK